jgi:hypothetical protein
MPRNKDHVALQLIGRNDSFFDIVSNLLFYLTKIVFRLQIQPELSLKAKISFESKGRVGGYASFAVYNLAYSVFKSILKKLSIVAVTFGKGQIFTAHDDES